MHTKTIRYGTKLVPTVVRGLIGQFPKSETKGISEYLYSMPYQKCNYQFGYPASECDDGRYPSVSTILGCTTPQSSLYWWQLKMIKQLGGLGQFKKYMRSRLKAGIDYHSCIHTLLNRCLTDNVFPEKLADQLIGENDAISAYLQSVIPVLRTFNCEFLQSERPVKHHGACYSGRFDAIMGYKDALFLIDWKTTTFSVNKKDTLEKMYNDPMQIAAYIGAVNCDPSFVALPEIRHGAVVLAQEDGSMATVVEMSGNELQIYWQKWIDHVHTFWSEMESRSEQNGIISFIDNEENICSTDQ